MKRSPLFLALLWLGACGAPGVDVVAQPGDFALVEAKLKG